MRIQSLWVPSLALALKSWLLFQMISLLSWTIMIEPRRGFAETSLVTISMEELQSSIFFSSLLFIVSVICIPNSIAFAFETVVIFPVSLFHWCYELINYHSSYSHPQYPYRCHSLIFSLVNLNLTFCILWEEAVGINLLVDYFPADFIRCSFMASSLKFFVVKYLKKFIGYLILYSPTFLGPSFHFLFGQQNTSHAFPFDLFLVLMLSLIAEKLLEDERKFWI